MPRRALPEPLSRALELELVMYVGVQCGKVAAFASRTGGWRGAGPAAPGCGTHFVTARNTGRCYLPHMDNAAFIALNRFGFGHRAGSALPDNARFWLRSQLAGEDRTPGDGGLDTEGALEVVAQQFALRQQRKAAADPGVAARPAGQAAAGQAASGQAGAAQGAMDPHPVGELAKQEARALVDRAIVTETPFRERLVWFWANHFTIADKTLPAAACSGAYIREAIRPHVTGRFSDMLLAVMRHPAMISYLNQERSAGPESVAGQRHHIGLNENLARESLELHTVSPASGYTQADVTNYAKVLTGWSFEIRQPPLGFRYRPNLHEPGEIEVMGRSWPTGEEGGVAILAWLATHPATYRHLATKLACHFVADDPARADVARIETVLRDTQGDLGAAAAALVELPDAWRPMAKLRTPQEWVVACIRALGGTPEQYPNILGICAGLGQPFFQAPFPIGWPDRAADWSGPEAMLQRVDFAYGLSARYANTDPVELGQQTLGPLLTADTLGQIKAAGSRRDGLTLLLSSPEFLRR